MIDFSGEDAHINGKKMPYLDLTPRPDYFRYLDKWWKLGFHTWSWLLISLTTLLTHFTRQITKEIKTVPLTSIFLPSYNTGEALMSRE